MLDWLFNGANVFVLPFWTLMILVPNWQGTRWIMKSFLPFVALVAIYGYLLAGTIDGESAAALANPQLADLARLFANPQATATGWVHFLVMDLFVGRWIYWEGQRTGIWTTHSLTLCLFAGPIGLLCHIITQGLGDRFFSSPPEGATPEAS
ncbi:ABA4-like family protein [Roseofilum casamattae]|uniref:ABA4-like family protein n=1 Tax=Roseofilum casamattae BLCC-M143 TaxID=3022442 RepID=A0ABT7BS50_9CYAN|nr:ABA4-like family protein [Roseofilum casamattae]MDJ1181597.1 ABA4-like family protein [Roseofilum casamattae BLCC-M143]